MSKLVYEYFKHQCNYETKYGINTIVLMQVGSFFEFYGYEETAIKNLDPGIVVNNHNLYAVASILGFSIAKKGKESIRRSQKKKR